MNIFKYMAKWPVSLCYWARLLDNGIQTFLFPLPTNFAQCQYNFRLWWCNGPVTSTVVQVLAIVSCNEWSNPYIYLSKVEVWWAFAIAWSKCRNICYEQGFTKSGKVDEILAFPLIQSHDGQRDSMINHCHYF